MSKSIRLLRSDADDAGGSWSATRTTPNPAGTTNRDRGTGAATGTGTGNTPNPPAPPATTAFPPTPPRRPESPRSFAILLLFPASNPDPPANPQAGLHLHLHLHRDASAFCRFAVVGSLGWVVDTSVLWSLQPWHATAAGLACAKLLAAETAMLHNFALNELWTFRDSRDAQTPRTHGIWTRLVRFHGICASSLVASVILLQALVFGLSWNPLLANAVVVGLMSIGNFLLNRRFTWARPCKPSTSANRE